MDKKVPMKLSTCVAVLVVGLIGCGDDGGVAGGNSTSLPPKDDLALGWQAFESGDYQIALTFFESAITEDPSAGEPWCGKGWTCLQGQEVRNCWGDFQEALIKQYEHSDAWAGKAVAECHHNLAEAIRAAEEVLSREPRYAFSHLPEFDWMDLRLIMAQAHFSRSEYSEANAQVDSLGGNPADPLDDSFVEDLMIEIERLGNLIRH